jgi:DNA-binding NtrC family response regulator
MGQDSRGPSGMPCWEREAETAVTIRVLLVDDEEEFVEALAQRLEIREFDVTTATSGAQALDRIAEKEIDLVILDVQMPEVDGLEVLQKIKQQKPLIEVIMLTGHATVQTAIDGMKLGAFDFLMKPTETEDLVEKINRAFSRKQEHDRRIREAEINEIVKRRGW